jgi:signal transduction histidine kinase
MTGTGEAGGGFSVTELVDEITRRSDSPAAARDRIAALVVAGQAIASDLELADALRGVVRVAVDLVSATHGSIEVVSPEGIPEALIEVSAAVVTGAVERGVLGVPVRVGDTVYGDMRLADSAHGAFDEVDERIALTLAGVAGTAIANARLYEEARLGQRWLVASEEINQRLLSGDLADNEVAPIADLILALADAEFVGLVLPTDLPDAPPFAQAFGPLADGAVVRDAGEIEQLPHRVRQALELKGERAAAFHEIETWASALIGSTLVIPWGDAEATREGALVITRGVSGHPYTVAERRMAKRFARSVAIARELAMARNNREHVALTDERDRIARDLHDHVIQSLFAVGLGLQSVLGSATGPVAARISSQIDAIDVTIRQIRQTIFELSSTPSASAYSQKQRFNQLVRTILEGEGIDSSLDFRGPVDTLIGSELGEEVSAVLREALSNVVRHADASRVDITIAVSPTEVRVVVTDNGRGLGEVGRRSGLDNLQHRAAVRGGRFTTAGRAPSGTTVDWAVPVVAA